MRRPPARWIFALAIVASPPLGAQSAPKAAMGKLVPVSDIRADWLEGGVESPNGRFYLLTSDAANDSGFLRYDRAKRSWAYLGRGTVGLGPRWSPDGRFVAYVRQADESRQWYLWLVPMDTATGLAGGPPRRVSTRPGFGPPGGPAAWSPDGRRLAFIARDSGRMSIVAVPFNGGDEQVLFEATGGLNSVVWSRDGRSVFVNHWAPNRAQRTLRVSLDDRRPVELGDAKAPTIDISPDGKWLAQYHFSRPVLYMLSTEGKSPRQVDLGPRLTRLTPSGWSHTNPDAMVALDHIAPTGIQRVSIADGRIRTVVAFDSGGLRATALSPDERHLAYIRLREGVTQLVLSDTSGGDVRVLADGARGALWSPTGQHIAHAMNETDIRVVEVASKKARELLPATLEPCGGPALNCDGRLPTRAWRSDARALRYFERRATRDGHALELHEVDLDGRERVAGTTTVPGIPSFIARNDTLFLVTQPNAVHLVNARTGVARVIYSGIARVPEHVDASGQWILLVAESGGNGTPFVEQPLLVSLTTGESRKFPYALGGEVSHGDFLPDGRNFLLTACVTCRDPGYVEKWDLILTPMNGDPPRILTGSESAFKDFWPVGVTGDGHTAYFKAEQSYNTRLVTMALPKF
jgi:Tol biopolymer transport system component